jgi:endonuclease I
MQSFSASKQIVEADAKSQKKMINDLYAISVDNKNMNVEHIIPASISGKREYLNSFENSQMLNNNFFVNYEPYGDLHFMFATDQCINGMRNSFVYGNVTDSMETIININDSSTKKNEYITCIQKKDDQIHLYFPKDSQIPVKDGHFTTHCYSEIDPSDISEMIKIYYNSQNADCKDCLFEPPDSTKGSIARVLFYFYLMYAYDVSKRPVVLKGMVDDLWLGYVGKTSIFTSKIRGAKDNKENVPTSTSTQGNLQSIKGNQMNDMIKEYGFNQTGWIHFFENHIDEYYEWHTKFPINDSERQRNRYIIEKTNVPNPLIGSFDQNNNYVDASPDLFDHLFFSAGQCGDYDNCDNMVNSPNDLISDALTKFTQYDPYLSVMIALNELNIKQIHMHDDDKSIKNTLSRYPRDDNGSHIIEYHETVSEMMKICDEITIRISFSLNPSPDILQIMDQVTTLKNTLFTSLKASEQLCEFFSGLKYDHVLKKENVVAKYLINESQRINNMVSQCHKKGFLHALNKYMQSNLFYTIFNVLSNDKSNVVYKLLGENKMRTNHGILTNLIALNRKSQEKSHGSMQEKEKEKEQEKEKEKEQEKAQSLKPMILHLPDNNDQIGSGFIVGDTNMHLTKYNHNKYMYNMLKMSK